MLETVPAKLLDAYVQDENALVIDLRSSEEYQSGHMRGAVNAPMGQFADGWPERERTIVLYCDRGAMSMAVGRRAFRTGISGEKCCGRVSCVPRDTDCDGARIRIDKNKAHALR